MKQHPIIDIDAHFTEPPDLWTSRAPATLKNRVLHVGTLPDGMEAWFIDDRYVGKIGPQVIDKQGEKVRGTTSLRLLEDMAAAGTSVSDRLNVMDSMGIAAQLLYPNVVGFGSSKLMSITGDEKLRLFHVTAYNDAIADIQRESGGRLFPMGVLPLWDVSLAVKEMKRCKEALGLTGFAMSNQPKDFAMPSLADAVWEPFFEACVDYEVPVNFHVGSGSSEISDGWWGSIEGDMKKTPPTLAAYLSVSFFLNNFRDIVNLILSGMLDKYPALRFVSVESGAGWIPFVIQSLEYTFDEILSAKDRRQFKLRPREYFQRQIYASYWFEDRQLVDTFLNDMGPDNLMFETDYPHPQTLYPNVAEKIEETLSHHPEDVQRKVLFETASNVYGIAVRTTSDQQASASRVVGCG